MDAAEPLRNSAPSITWADATKLHLTLKFLGEQPDDAAERVARALDDVAARHREFPVSVGEIGAFPNFRRARVVWMGVEREPRLELLQHDVEVACADIGYEVEGRAFRPHLTLARVRETTPESERRALARAGRRVAFAEDAPVRSIDLMRSVRSGAGSLYELLHASSLRAA